MSLIKIENHKNFWIENTARLDNYLTEGFFDLDSPRFKKANKTPLRDFILVIRVSKVLDGKQKFKKRKFVITDKDNLTILQALKKLSSIPDDLLSQLKSDADMKKIREDEAQLQAERDREQKINRSLNSVWDEFYDHKINGTDAELKVWRENTARTYRSFYDLWIRDTDMGDTPVNEVTKDACNALISQVKAKRSLRTASTVIEVLRPLFDWYFDKHEIDRRNPVPKKGKNSFDLKNERVVDLSIDLIRKLYQVIDHYDDPLYRRVFVWLRTGRRRGEIVSLKMENIDTIDKTFLIEARNNKADVDMEYKLRPELEATLNGDRYLFESPVKKGQPIHADSIKKHWEKIIEQTGGTFKLNGKRVPISNLHLHDIRHIIGGVLKRASVPEEIRGKVLGHKKQGITDRYGPDYYGDIDEAYQLFEDIVYGRVPKDMKWSDL